MLIEHRQRDVGQERGQDPALRGAGVGVLAVAGLGHHTGLEERLHQQQHAFVFHPMTHPVHQGRVVDRVETRLDVRVQHPPITAGAEHVDLGDRVLRPPLWPEPVRDRQKVGLENRFQHQLQRRLDHPVRDGRDPQLAEFPRATGFRDLALSHRQRPERALLERGAQFVQEPRDTQALLDIGGRETVDAGRVCAPVTRDPGERHDQRCRVVHEVEHIVEPAAGIGRRPTVKLGLHLRYPLPRPLRDLGRGATVRWCVFRHYSHHLPSIRCRPSPCAGLSPARSTNRVRAPHCCGALPSELGGRAFPAPSSSKPRRAHGWAEVLALAAFAVDSRRRQWACTRRFW